MSTSFSRRRSLNLALALALTFSLAAGSWPVPQRAADRTVNVPAEAPAETNAEIEQRAREAYGKLGVSFEENRGQVDERVRFLSRGGGATVFLTGDEAAFVLSATDAPDSAAEEPTPEALRMRGRSAATRERPKLHAVSMKFEGANPSAEVLGERELEGRVNYFRGSDPSKWQTNVKTYGAVRYRGIYDGVDLIYYGNGRGQMEYDFLVAPGTDPRQISLLVEGAKAVELQAAGDLVINTPAGEMRQRRPTVYQEVGGARREVAGGYVVEAGGRVRFALGQYDRSAPLVIDPVLEYSTLLGGSHWDEGCDIAVDSSGCAYVTGYTEAINFPTKDALKDAKTGYTDAFVTKLDATGSALVYSTYLGGSSSEDGLSIAVDSSGNAYVTGDTGSCDFPTVNAVQGTCAGYGDAFVTKLNAAGSALVYSTYLGGSYFDLIAPGYMGIAVDSAGNAYVTGATLSHDFPVVNAVQGARSGGSDAFVTKLNADGSAFVYSTYLGGDYWDYGFDIAVDSAGNAYVTGATQSFGGFPVVNAVQGTFGGGDVDAFVTKLNAAGSAFVYSTYLGGGSEDWANAIAVDSSGNAYVAGETSSNDFPTKHAIQSANEYYSNQDDAFVTKLNAAGTALVYSTYLGGLGRDGACSVAVDSSGKAYVVGFTASKDFPTRRAIQSANKGDFDAFVSKLNEAGSAFVYSTYLGGGSVDYINSVATDPAGNCYLTGLTRSYNFPTVNPFRTAHHNPDAFVTKISILSIRGRVVIQGARGVVGVPWTTVKLSGTQTMTKLTDVHGFYAFTDLTPGGDYTVMPSKTNLSFVPESQSFTDLSTSLSDINFTVPSLSVSDAVVTERNWFAATATFTVTLQPASTEPVTLTYQTADGATNSATAGTDYTALPPTTLTFNPGETTKTVTVKVKGDTLDEPNETFRLLLSAPANALISDSKGVCTITDDD